VTCKDEVLNINVKKKKESFDFLLENKDIAQEIESEVGKTEELQRNDFLQQPSSENLLRPRGGSFGSTEGSLSARNSNWDLKLKSNDWDDIFNCLVLSTFEKNSIILKQGDTTQKIHQVISGSCRIELKEGREGKIKIIGSIEKGEIFGDVTYVLGGTAIASVIANENVEIAYLEKTKLESFLLERKLKQQPRLVVGFNRYLSKHLCNRYLKISQLLIRKFKPPPLSISKSSDKDFPANSDANTNVDASTNDNDIADAKSQPKI